MHDFNQSLVALVQAGFIADRTAIERRAQPRSA